MASNKANLFVLYKRIHDPARGEMLNWDRLGRRLSDVVGRNKPWTGKYIRSVAYGDKGFRVTEEMALAIGVLLNSSDLDERGFSVEVKAIHNIPPGALVQGEARLCASRYCDIIFIPKWHSSKYCCPDCYRKEKNARRRERRQRRKRRGV